MKAVILVGGEGKRMGGVVKPLLKKNGKTVLSYIIDNLNKYNIKEVYWVVDDKKEFKNFGYRTVKNFAELKQIIKEDFLLLMGDTIADINFNDLINFHNENPKFMTVVTQDYEIPYGVIESGKWNEKPVKEIAIGIFVCKPENLTNEVGAFTRSIKEFKTYKFNGKFIHLTEKGDYERWKESKF